MQKDIADANHDKATADAWDEGGTNRVMTHIIGGGLIGGLGGGSIGTAAAGAAGAGMASAFGGKLNGLADNIGDATGSMLIGNVTSNILAGVGGAIVGGGAGAATASSVHLYNDSSKNANGTAGTGSEFLNFVGDQIASAGRGAANLAEMANHGLNRFFAAGSGQQPPADANPLIDVSSNQKPPTAGPSAVPVPVCVPPVCMIAPAVTPGTPGYVPSNATFNSGDNGSGENTMLGADGAQFASKTIWKGDGKERIDVENPNPGQRPGQIHYQDNQGNKYLYDPSTNSFPDAPNSINRLLNDPSFSSAIQKDLTNIWGGK